MISPRVQSVLEELERLEQTFVIKGVPDAYKEIWVPNNEIRLWSVPRRTGQLLHMFVLAHRPKTILELGTSAGYSTLWLATAAEQLGSKVHTIELTQPKYDLARTHFATAGLTDSIIQIQGSIHDVLTTWNKKIDFVFLDADKPQYRHYLELLEPHLEPGAMLIADNAVDFGPFMQDYLSYLEASPNYETQLIDLDHGLSIAVKIS